jgi:hypothetical protein
VSARCSSLSKVWPALFVLVVVLAAPGCNAVCGQGASCNDNAREDCVDRGEVWGGNNLVVTDCGRFTCVDFGQDALCVHGSGKDPLCPADGVHDLCDGSLYYRCVFGYRAAQKDCGTSTCDPGRRGCGIKECASGTTCTRESPGCSQSESRYVCSNGSLWVCSPGDTPAEDMLTFHSDCDYMGLSCNTELGECALP